MKLDVHLMALLIIFCHIIQQLQKGENMFLCLKCSIEYDALTYGKYVVFQPIYVKALLLEHPFYILLLLLLNIGLHI
jgi:hypothetical protein